MTPRARELVRSLFRSRYLGEWQLSPADEALLLELVQQGLVDVVVKAGPTVYKVKCIWGSEAA